MSIKVVNKQTHTPTKNDEYVGRPTCLGNPFTHLGWGTKAEFKVDTRQEAVDAYLSWLRKQYRANQKVYQAVNKLVDKHLAGQDINLVCWCAPLACHGDVLKVAIEKIAEQHTNL